MDAEFELAALLDDYDSTVTAGLLEFITTTSCCSLQYWGLSLRFDFLLFPRPRQRSVHY